MGKRILITSTDMMMIQFLVPHVLYLRNQGFDVEVACSEVGNRLDEVREKLGAESVHQVHLVRSPFKFQNLKGYHELKQLLNTEYYDLVWTNEPVMGIMTRLAARETRRKGTKVLYMTHGYHFFKGCQLRYKIFYPIEKMASRLCDCIVTISNEDFETTKNKFYAKQVEHINGIGFDFDKFSQKRDKIAKRKELSLKDDDIVILSVGELKQHKNHKIIIDALAKLHNLKYVYIICGKGELLNKLEERAERYRIKEQVRFLGYRKDINEILCSADYFAFPSIREGLGLASLEAMASGLPVVASDTRGIRDYVIDGVTGYLCRPNKIDDYIRAFTKLPKISNKEEIAVNCREMAQKYSFHNVAVEVLRIIRSLI